MVKHLKVEIYDITVVFLINPTKVEFETFYHDNVTRINDEEYKQMYKDVFNNDTCAGFTFVLGCGSIVFYVKEPYSEHDVAHEILHTTNDILGSRGITADFDNDEAQAYLCGYLTKKYYEYIYEMTKENEGKKSSKATKVVP